MYQVAQLELPFWTAQTKSKRVPVEIEQINWQLDEVIKLHGILLEESLAILKSKDHQEDKLDVLQWVFTDFVEVEVFEDGKPPYKQLVSTAEMPFSFLLCCKLEGMDAEGLRDILRHLYAIQEIIIQ